MTLITNDSMSGRPVLILRLSRSVYHAATPDYVAEEGLGERTGSRAVSLGEKPYYDPQSVSRREGLAQELDLALAT